MSEVRYPHCDPDILHAPKECHYCDQHPDWQAERIISKVNFTGHYDKDKRICPAEMKRNLPNIEKWPGNIKYPSN